MFCLFFLWFNFNNCDTRYIVIGIGLNKLCSLLFHFKLEKYSFILSFIFLLFCCLYLKLSLPTKKKKKVSTEYRKYFIYFNVWPPVCVTDESDLLERHAGAAPRCGGDLLRAKWPTHQRAIPEAALQNGLSALGVAVGTASLWRQPHVFDLSVIFSLPAISWLLCHY